MSSFPCRCTRTACRARQTLARHPDDYLRPRKCRACGRATLKTDRYRARIETRRNVCYRGRGGCYEYSFPHARGRGWCEHNPQVTRQMREERGDYMGARYA
jgi:hypothetical protein